MQPRRVINPQIYIDYYTGQGGGSIPVFRGGVYQSGGGIGDVLKGIFRTVIPIIAPVAAKTAKSFLSSAVGGLQEGKNIQQSMKDALTPAGRTMFASTMKKITKKKPTKQVKRKTSSQKGKGIGRKVYKGKSRTRKALTNRRLNYKHDLHNF